MTIVVEDTIEHHIRSLLARANRNIKDIVTRRGAMQRNQPPP
jgi:hypothetical protein